MRYIVASLMASLIALTSPAHADPLDGVLPLAQDDIAAVSQAKALPDRHVMLFFGDQMN